MIAQTSRDGHTEPNAQDHSALCFKIHIQRVFRFPKRIVPEQGFHRWRQRAFEQPLFELGLIFRIEYQPLRQLLHLFGGFVWDTLGSAWTAAAFESRCVCHVNLLYMKKGAASHGDSISPQRVTATYVLMYIQ